MVISALTAIDSDGVEVMMKNAQQLKALVDAAFPEFDRLIETFASNSREDSNLERPSKANRYHCSNQNSDIEELACLWAKAESRNVVFESEELYAEASGLLSQICVHTQKMLSGVASNYDLKAMVCGIVIMVIASLLAIAKWIPTTGDSTLADASFILMIVLYGVMMFASSFVEEEHHFWYWVATGWFAALFFKEYYIPNTILLNIDQCL